MRLLPLGWLLAGLLLTAPAHAQTITGLFGCTTDSNHERWALKTRPKPSSLASAQAVSVAAVLGWAVPAGHHDTETSAIPPREPKLFKLTGVVRKIKLSDDDCDPHLEIAATGAAGAKRVIVEIPANRPSLQQIAATMFNLSPGHTSHAYNGAKAIRVVVTGYAFIDLSHQCANDPHAGCLHGGADVKTLWELHPLFGLKRAQ